MATLRQSFTRCSSQSSSSVCSESNLWQTQCNIEACCCTTEKTSRTLHVSFSSWAHRHVSWSRWISVSCSRPLPLSPSADDSAYSIQSSDEIPWATLSKVPRKILGKLLILGVTDTQVATSSRGYSATVEHCTNRPINSVQRSNRKLCSSSSNSSSKLRKHSAHFSFQSLEPIMNKMLQFSSTVLPKPSLYGSSTKHFNCQIY